MKHSNFLESPQDEDTTSTHPSPSDRIEIEDEDYPDLTPPVFTEQTPQFNDNFFQRCNKKFQEAVNSKNEKDIFYEKLSTAFSAFFFIDSCISKFLGEVTKNNLEEDDFQSISISQKQMKNAINEYFLKAQTNLIKEGIKAFDYATEISPELIKNFEMLRKVLKCQKKFEKALYSYVEKYQKKSEDQNDEFINNIFPACKKEIIKKLSSYQKKALLKDQYLGGYFDVATVLYAKKEFNAAIFATKLSTNSTSRSPLRSLSLTFNEI